MNWNAEQQRLLQALGHDLMVHGTQWPAAGTALVGAALAATPRPGPIATKAAPTKAAATKPAASPTHEKLFEALRRAAGGNDISAVVDDVEKLRSQPALKRALWPRLRALRRSH